MLSHRYRFVQIEANVVDFAVHVQFVERSYLSNYILLLYIDDLLKKAYLGIQYRRNIFIYSDFRRQLGIHNNDKLYELHVVQTVFEKQKQSMWKTSCTSKGNHSYLKVLFHLEVETTFCKMRNLYSISIIEISARHAHI